MVLIKEDKYKKREVMMNIMKNFTNLGINIDLQETLKKHGIIEPTPIQAQVIPALLEGRDLVGQAQTGTGKTLAFLLPMMENIDVDKPFIQGLIITPTRELAIQITEEAKKLTPAKAVNILAAYGGQDVERQIKKLRGNIHIVIGTPGRLLDHLRRQTVDFRQLRMLVLDEGDQMLHMGFLQEVEDIINQTSKGRQTMLFSATMPKKVNSIASQYLNKPLHIRIQSSNITLDEIEQVAIETTDRGKQEALVDAINKYKPFMAIVFCRTKRRASALNNALQSMGYLSDELHGDLSQAKRERVMKDFKALKLQLLVATDVAARGIDIEGITHVFNYDLPQDTDSYIHRIGRTGRAGERGVAITFLTPRDYQVFNVIEKEIKTTIEVRKKTQEKNHKSGNKSMEKRMSSRDKLNKSNKFNKNKKSSNPRDRQDASGRRPKRKRR